MENLVLPIMVVVILTIAAVVNYIDGKPERKERVLKVIGKALILVVATVTISILFGGVLYGAFAEEEIPWQNATADGSVEVTLKGETAYVVVFTTDDGNILSYFGDMSVAKGTKLRVKISPYGETLDAEVDEPKPIWFPPIMLLGAVAPIVRKKKVVIKQKMHPDFFMTKEKYEKDAKQHIAIDLEDSRTFVFVYNTDRTKQVFAIPSGIEKAISEATRINPAAFVTTFVPAYGHQAVVFCNYHEHLGAWLNTSYSEKINEARKLLTSSVQIVESKPEVKKIANGGKDDIAVMMVECTIDEDPKQRMYTFRTVEALNVGDRRTAKLKSGERKPVTVRNILPPCFASQLDHPLNWYVTLEVFLLKEHENVGVGKRIPANGVLTEEEMAAAQRRVDSMVCMNNNPIGLTGYDEFDPDWYLPRG